MSIIIAAIGAGIILIMGLGHAVFTLQSTPEGGPMMPLDPEVRAAMQKNGGVGMAPEIDSNLFKAWIGFNLSHAFGIIVIAGIVMYQVLDDFGAALDQPWFVALIVLVPVTYFVLAVRYWFADPRNGIVIATTLLWAGALIEVA